MPPPYTGFYGQDDQGPQDYRSPPVTPLVTNPIPMMLQSALTGGAQGSQGMSILNGLMGLSGLGGIGGGIGAGSGNTSVFTPGALSTPGTTIGMPGGLGGGGGEQGAGGWLGAGKMGDVGAGIAGLQTLGNLWMGFKQMKLANKSFKMNKMMAETNLANTMKAYNTSLADRARSRGFTEGQDQGQIDRYVEENRAVRAR